MAEISGCHLPENLYYWPEKHVWARPEADGTVTIGITDVAQRLARAIVAFTPKRVGRKLGRGKSAGTLESGKWVGPVNTPVAGTVVAVNKALRLNPRPINEDPYGEGWIARIQPTDWESDKAALVTGAKGLEAYRQFLETEGISCA